MCEREPNNGKINFSLQWYFSVGAANGSQQTNTTASGWSVHQVYPCCTGQLKSRMFALYFAFLWCSPFFCSVLLYYYRAGHVGPALLAHTHHLCISVCVCCLTKCSDISVMAPGLSHVYSEEIIFTGLAFESACEIPSCGCEAFQSMRDSDGFGCNSTRSIPPEAPFWIKRELGSYLYSLHTNSTAVITKIIGSVSYLW